MVTDHFKNRSPVTVGAAFAAAGFAVQFWSQAADGALTQLTEPASDAGDEAKEEFEAQLCKHAVVIVQAIKAA